MAAGSKVTFELTYEELLKRHKGKYEMYLKVQPKQLVKHFEVISCSPAAPAETAGGRVLGRVPGQTPQQGQEHRNPAPTTWLGGVGELQWRWLQHPGQGEEAGRHLADPGWVLGPWGQHHKVSL